MAHLDRADRKYVRHTIRPVFLNHPSKLQRNYFDRADNFLK